MSDIPKRAVVIWMECVVWKSCDIINITCELQPQYKDPPSSPPGIQPLDAPRGLCDNVAMGTCHRFLLSAGGTTLLNPLIYYSALADADVSVCWCGYEMLHGVKVSNIIYSPKRCRWYLLLLLTCKYARLCLLPVTEWGRSLMLYKTLTCVVLLTQLLIHW